MKFIKNFNIPLIILLILVILSLNINLSQAQNKISAEPLDIHFKIYDDSGIGGFFNDEDRVYAINTVNAYTINSDTYVSLKDIAYCLNNSILAFDIKYNQKSKTIEIIKGKSYSQKTKYTPYENTKTALKSNIKLSLDNNIIPIEAYLIENNNYFNLKTLSKYLGFEISFDEENSYTTMIPFAKTDIKTKKSFYNTSIYTSYNAINVISSNDNQYIIPMENGNIQVLEFIEDKIIVDEYDSKYKFLKSFNIATELKTPYLFHNGKSGYYIAFGQDSYSENDNSEVIRIVKYDKNFKRLKSVSINAGEVYSTKAFEFSNGSLLEEANQLVLHIGRGRYDGHQSQLTLYFNPNTLDREVLGEDIMFQYNHVSHSLGQKIVYHNGDFFLIDLSDAAPIRGIIAHKKVYSQPSFITKEDKITTSNVYTLLTLDPYYYGANHTGVLLGDAKILGNNLVVTANTVDSNKITHYDSFEMTADKMENVYERNPIVLISKFSSNGLSSVKRIDLENNFNKNKISLAPRIIKLDDKRALILWANLNFKGYKDYYEATKTKLEGIRYAIIDENTTKPKIYSIPHGRISSRLQPVLIGNKIVWYYNFDNFRVFQEIKL